MSDINAFINVWLFIYFDNFDRLRSAGLVDTSNKKKYRGGLNETAISITRIIEN